MVVLLEEPTREHLVVEAIRRFHFVEEVRREDPAIADAVAFMRLLHAVRAV
jgi:hypothetical protein